MTTAAILAVTIPTRENRECEKGRPKPPFNVRTWAVDAPSSCGGLLFQPTPQIAHEAFGDRGNAVAVTGGKRRSGIQLPGKR